MGEVEGDVCDLLYHLVAVELTSVVRCDRFVAVVVAAYEADDGTVGLKHGDRADLADFDISAFALNQGDHRVLARSVHRVDLPVPHTAPSFDFRRTLVDHAFPGKLSPAVVGSVSLPALLACAPQVFPQRTSVLLIRPDPLVDGLMADT